VTPGSPACGTRSALIGWTCDHCTLSVFGPRNVGELRKALAPVQQARARAAFDGLIGRQRQMLARKHQLSARILYGVALVAFANCIHMLASGVALVVSVNWAWFSVMFAVLGLKRAYRAWQVRSGRLFEIGAFGHWLRHERWLC
jgi:hypothetical protein